jgi:DegV family protein with EDD domain
MPRIGLITDSTAYIPPDLVAKYDIKVIPQVLIWGEETLLDGIDISPSEFYARLQTAKEMPTTSQATAGAFKELFDPLVAEGAPILAVLLSEKLSGTIASAEQAKAMFPGARIEIVDSEATAMALGFQILAAARAAAEGKPFDEVVEIAREAKDHTGVLFVVDTLEFLHRGGRIGGASRLLGTALNIKPLLELKDGRIEPLERVRTMARAQARLLDVIDGRVAGKTPVRVATVHAAAEAQARALLAEAEKRWTPVEALMAEASPVVGTHTGPGTVGLAYCAGI